MLKLNSIDDAMLSQSGKYRINAKKAMFETDPVKKKFYEDLAKNAMARAFAFEDQKKPLPALDLEI